MIGDEQDLRREYPPMLRHVHVTRGGLRGLRQHVVEADARARYDSIVKGNEGLARLVSNRSEGTRILNEIRTEILTARRRATGAALHALRAVEMHVQEWRTLIRTCQRDVLRSPCFARALHGVTPDGMITLAAFRVTEAERLATLPISDLVDVYRAACNRGDAAAFVDAEIIEALAPRTGTAKTEADLEHLKRLREIVSWQEEERVPANLPDYEGLLDDVRRCQQRAEALELPSIHPGQDPLAQSAYDNLEREMLAGGIPSDGESLEAVRASLVKASNQ